MSESQAISAFVTSTTFDDTDVVIGNDGPVTKKFTGSVVANGAAFVNRYQPILEPMTDFGNSSGVTRTMDLSSSRLFRVNLTGAVTFAVINPPTAGLVATFGLEVTASGGSAGWPSSFKWAGGSAPVFSSGTVRLVSGYTRDAGVTYRVSVSEAFS